MDVNSEQPVDSTVELVQRARKGDRDAMDLLCRRYMRPLSRWARHRLPGWARELMNTEDLVQETLLRTVRNLDHFSSQHPGALHGYMRRVLENLVLDEKKKISRAPLRGELRPDVKGSSTSPLERLIGREKLERYEHALEMLDADAREAVLARIEYGMTYKEIAEAMGGRTKDGVRMTISRALARMAAEIGHES